MSLEPSTPSRAGPDHSWLGSQPLSAALRAWGTPTSPQAQSCVPPTPPQQFAAAKKRNRGG